MNISRKIFSFCNYIPEELIIACGLNPVRIWGNGRPILKANAYLPTNVCSFARNCYDYVMESGNDALGFIFANSCHTMESLHEVVRDSVKDKPNFMLNVPRQYSELAVEYFAFSLEKLFDFLKTFFPNSSGTMNLNEAIAQVNQKRVLRSNIEELIAQGRLYVNHREYQNLIKLYSSDSGKFMDFANRLINSEKKPSKGPRIMLSGSVYAPMDLGEIIEENGGVVVLYDNCNGIRQTTPLVECNEAPFTAIAQSYLKKPICARHNHIAEKVEEVANNIEKYSIDAVIFSVMKFCADQSYGVITIIDMLKKRGIPFLFLDSEYTNNSSGQVLTRVQTFLEQL